MDAAEAGIEEGQFAADVMLRNPKTLSASATVADVRAQLANPKVQMVLVAEDGRFLGSLSAVPDTAAGDGRALDYADADPETIAPDASAMAAFEQAAVSPHRRVIVVDEERGLLGLVCLDPGRTRFCQASA